MSKKVLGKGIGALLGEEGSADVSSATEVSLDALKPNPHQPRRDFDDERLAELAESIRQKGVLQPILAEAAADGSYVIVAGERRVRAARLAGLAKIPVVIRQFSGQEKLEIALIENLQREDLSPIEEALAYRSMMEMADLSQEQVAAKVGKERSTVANTLRLLRLPEEAQAALEKGAITPGHARAILALLNPADQQVLLRRISERGLSVRDAEEMAAALNRGRKENRPPGRGGKPAAARREPEIREIEHRLMEKLGTKVDIRGSGNKGRIQISYFSAADLERLLELLE
jgi:ParB family chromosome partitioning protein